MKNNTFSNGCLGSHNDEERSEMRYVMRIAWSASHQNFERSLHFSGSMSVGVSVHPLNKDFWQRKLPSVVWESDSSDEMQDVM